MKGTTVKNRIALFAMMGTLTLGLAACGGDDTATTPAGGDYLQLLQQLRLLDDRDRDRGGHGRTGRPRLRRLRGRRPRRRRLGRRHGAGPGGHRGLNNPLLKTLTATVTGAYNPDVNLVDTLNGDEFTVFAPVDDAFAKIDAATLESLKTDAAR